MIIDFLNELIDYENGYVVTMNRMIVGKDNLHLYVEVWIYKLE